MCSKQSMKPHYNLTSAFVQEDVGTVCKSCCIREYYGSKHTQSRKYKLEMSQGRLFGIKEEKRK